jgi:RND family efflux transporter MFP subunit
MGFALLGAALALGFAACSRGEAGPAVRPRLAPQVIVVPVEKRNVDVEVEAPVDLRPLAQADVGSKVLGYVDAVFVDRGDRVKKGQLVALVRPSDLPDQLTAARSALGQNQASAALARTNFERANKLAPSGIVSQQELQAASAALASAESAEAAAKAQIAAIGVRLGETRIESPIDGVVATRRLDPGALVGPPGGGAIITVVRIDTLRVFMTVNEQEATRVEVGQDAKVYLDALSAPVSGKVVRIAPSFDPVTRTLEAEVQLPNPGNLRPGMYGRGKIRLETHPNMPVASVDAVQISAGNRYVFVLHGDKVEKRPVVTGAEVDDGDKIEITSGLKPTEEVVVAGADGLSDGSVVRPVRGVDPFSGARAAAVTPPAPASSGQRPDSTSSKRD